MSNLISIIIKRLLCNHAFEFVRNIHGDEIYMTGRFKRSWWRCVKCGKLRDESFLNEDTQTTEQ
jgi:hypothetical protein